MRYLEAGEVTTEIYIISSGRLEAVMMEEDGGVYGSSPPTHDGWGATGDGMGWEDMSPPVRNDV